MKPLDQLADASFTEACHLELSGLTSAEDRCGGCHHKAGDHRHWKHRAKEEVSLRAVLEEASASAAKLPASVQIAAERNRALEATESRCARCHMHIEDGVRMCPMCEEDSVLETRLRAATPVPSFVPATKENVHKAFCESTDGVYVFTVPEDVREVAQAIYSATAIFWLNPERSASRWKSKDAVAHACAGCSHALQHMRGRVLDPDTGKPHLHLAAARMLLAVAQLSAGKGGV
jgi:hypothetical protein